MARQTTPVEDAPNGKTLTLGEVGDPGPIEQAAEFDAMQQAMELEAFMNEYVTIIVAPSAEEGALPVIVPSVNSVNQPIIAGVEQRIRRKYVEALARCRYTKYVQKVPDPSRPENIQMIPKTVFVHPFEVIKDTAKGHAWLKAIRDQP